MSDHSEVLVAPVEVCEPPYYVAVFTTLRTQEQNGYSETNARMEDLVQSLPGYLGMDHAQTPGGLGITVSYTLHVAKVERSSGFIRAEDPQSPTAD